MVWVEQIGSNTASVTQQAGADGSDASVYQNGSLNEATILQVDGNNDAGVEWNSRGLGGIEQTGVGNEASITQEGSNLADVTQNGDDNFARVNQSGIGPNSAISLQTGDNG